MTAAALRRILGLLWEGEGRGRVRPGHDTTRRHDDSRLADMMDDGKEGGTGSRGDDGRMERSGPYSPSSAAVPAHRRAEWHENPFFLWGTDAKPHRVLWRGWFPTCSARKHSRASDRLSQPQGYSSRSSINRGGGPRDSSSSQNSLIIMRAKFVTIDDLSFVDLVQALQPTKIRPPA